MLHEKPHEHHPSLMDRHQLVTLFLEGQSKLIIMSTVLKICNRLESWKPVGKVLSSYLPAAACCGSSSHVCKHNNKHTVKKSLFLLEQLNQNSVITAVYMTTFSIVTQIQKKLISAKQMQKSSRITAHKREIYCLKMTICCLFLKECSPVSAGFQNTSFFN